MIFEQLETERLNLKNIGIEDRDFVFKMFSDFDVNEYLFDAEPLQNISEADEIIGFYLQPEPCYQHRWIMIRKEDNKKIGTCGFHCWDAINSIVDIGYDLNKECWKNGYAFEALQALIKFAEVNLKVRTINACIYHENINSIRLVEKLGFVPTGTTFETFREKKYLHHVYSLVLQS